MKSLRIYAVLVLFLGLLFNGTAFAQQVSGTLTGQVTDQTGAAVPGAAITLKDLGTGATRQATSNSSGEYSFQSTAVGTYRLDVAAPSFKGYTANNVIVNVASITRIDPKLSAGAVSETVQVSADAVQVNTDSGSLGALVDGTQVKELPLNGRSFVELTQLTPGVSAANNFDSKNKGLQGGVDFSVNGNPTTNNLFLVDGANDNDTGSNRTILIYPSIDAIAEFKMLTNSYGAEYGQASGAIISIVTRSGTNKFHGSAFYDGRNDALASYTYFARRNAGKGQALNGKDKLRRNDWGGSLGGPIFRDKLFFFADAEWNHEIRGYTQAACVASAAERAGDFSNPSCGEPKPTIPVALQKAGNPYALNALDPAGTLLAQYYTLPNQTPATPGGNNWSQSLPTFLKYHQYSGRVDYNLTQHNLIMGKYTQDGWTNPSYNGNQYWGDTAFPVINGNWAQPSKQIVARWTSTISDSLVNDAEFAYSNNRINITPGGTDPGLLNQLSAAIPTIYPQSLKTATAGTPTVWGGLGAYGSYNTIWSIAPWNNALDLYTLRDDVSKVAGHHALKIGGFVGYSKKNEDSGPASSEHPIFQTFDSSVNTNAKAGPVGVTTGNNLANVLIPGNPFNLNENSTNVRAQLRWKDLAAYVDDTYKVTPRLTLNLGVRYEIIGPTYQPKNQITNFQPNLYDPSKPKSDACNGLLIAPGTDPCGAANAKFGTAYSHGTPFSNKYLVNTNYHLISPRLGLAYDVFGNGTTAIRAGFGEFYQRERVSRYQLVNNAPFSVNSGSVIRALGGASLAASSFGAKNLPASPSGGFDTSNTIPRSFQYNLTVEQELAKNTDLQISYVGNRGQHLTSSYDVNGVSVSNYAAASFAPGSSTQSFRRFTNDNSIAFFTHNGDSYYNSLQVALKTQVTSAFRLGAAYTWSHGIADVLTDDSSGGTGAQSFTVPTNPRFDRGNSATNRPNIFVANVTYFAPKLDGHNFAEREVLGGWEVTGITSADSGNSFTVYQPGISDGAAGSTISGALFQSGLTGNQRPLITPGQTCSSGGISGDQVINPNAFTLIGYHIGTVDPGMAPRGYCHGPHLINTDLSLDKNWKVHDLVTVQFRLDAFDVFNHANFRADQGNFGTPFTSINCGASFQQAGTAGHYNPCTATNNVITHQVANPLFGRSVGLVGNAERQFQYALHLEF